MKKVLIALVLILLLVVGIFAAMVFIVDTDFAVERDVVVNKPRAEVFDYVKHLKNQNEWGPWVQKDPKVKLTYTGEDGSPGFISKWESEHEELGVGEQEIKKIVDGERLETELRFIKPWESKSNAYIATEDAGEGKTKVKWGFTGSLPRPFNLMLVFTDFKGMVGKDFEEGLGKLKSVLESKPSPQPESDEASDQDSDGEKKDDGAKDDDSSS